MPAIAVATSAVRTPKNAGRLSQATHIRMPSGTILRNDKAVSVFSTRCLWSDALTKVVMLGAKRLAADCLTAYDAKALIFAARGGVKEVVG